MKINENWQNGVAQGISEKSGELKQVCLAGKLRKELEDKSLEKLLADYLPALDETQRREASDGLKLGIHDLYKGLNEQVTDTQVEAFLNDQLAGKGTAERGKLLTGLLKCAAEMNPESLEGNARWQELADKTDFQDEEVRELIAMYRAAVDQHAGFMARQAFRVMEMALGNLPQALVDEQLHSGEEYATAYAAAMYIISQQSAPQPGQEWLQPYQMGLLAAQSVESSRILALCHYGKLRAEEALPKLAKAAGAFLLQAAGFALRVGISALVYASAYALAATILTSSLAIAVVSIVSAAAALIFSGQDEAVDMVCEIWDAVKQLIGLLLHIGKPDEETQAVLSTVENGIVEEVETVSPVCTPHPSVTV